MADADIQAKAYVRRDTPDIACTSCRRTPGVQALLDLQTVNAQKNLEEKLKSILDRMIRSSFQHQTAEALS